MKLQKGASDFHLATCVPFILCFISQAMIDFFVAMDIVTLFLDFTGAINRYAYPVGVLMALNSRGRGIPLAFCITSSESSAVIEYFLGL